MMRGSDIVVIRVAFIGNIGVVGNPSGRVSQSTQVRVLNVARSLETQYGMETKVMFPLRDSPQEMNVAIARADVAVFHRIQGSRHTWVDLGYLGALATAKRLRKKVIFDVDDAIHLTFPAIAQMVAMSSMAVFAGSHALVGHYAKVSRSVSLVPSAVDIDLIGPTPRKEKSDIVIGWHGSVRGHLDNLLLLSNVLARLSEKYDFTFKVVGTAGDLSLQRMLQQRFPRIRLNFGPDHWFAYSELPRFMSDVDIGLYPLRDSRWSRAKCSMKLLEYMAMELPSCSSAIGENSYIIRDEENGFLAANDSEWVARIGNLIDDGGLRKDMGIRARRSVLESYSLSIVTRSIERIIAT
jgi:glycosyltransferase involved in cell wall biosynthesis